MGPTFLLPYIVISRTGSEVGNTQFKLMGQMQLEFYTFLHFFSVKHGFERIAFCQTLP
jgi:hypothetical protein